MSEQTAAGPLPAVRETAQDWSRIEVLARERRTRAQRSWSVLRALADIGALLIAGSLTRAASEAAMSVGWRAALLLVTIAAVAAMGAYADRVRLSLFDELRRVVTATSLASLLITATALIAFRHTGIGDAAVVHWAVATALILAGRSAIVAAQRTARARGQELRRTLIVGAGEVGRLTARRLLDEPQFGLDPVGFLDKEPMHPDELPRGAELPLLPVFGASWDLDRVLVEQRIDQVIIAFSTAPHSVLLQIVRTCWSRDVSVMVVPRLYEVEGRRVESEHLGALPLIRLHSSDPGGWQFRLKYALDRIVAAVILLLLAPVLAIVATAILVTMGRPVLFRQWRVGRDGRRFQILKFRTMSGDPARDGEANAHWAALAVGAGGDEPGADPVDRRTPLGALLRDLSLDELPQLWNVVRGDMSLVGPRPELPHYVTRFEQLIPRYPDRHRVKSGLTGWAQIHGLRGDTSLRDRVEWDNFYIENWSIWLDLRIILLTLPAFLGRGRPAADERAVAARRRG